MNNSSGNLLNSKFSHIYIEQDLINHPRTKAILARFPDAVVTLIKHYKDVFSRSRQSFILQKQVPSLILAKKTGTLLYEGAPVCQDFGNHHFYYTSCIMNCIYDCEYCYLQGMYPSANLVVFLNIEDIFHEVEQLLTRHNVYLSVSYDTDLLALEGLFSFTHEWIAFARKHSGLTIEIRTKSANFSALRNLQACNQVILAWTLSPEENQKSFEHQTPSLQARIQAAKEAMDAGYPVRLCFDPLLYVPDYKRKYSEMMATIFSLINPEKVYDASIGVFRTSNEYLKRMRHQRPQSSVLMFPYEQRDGVYQYEETISNELISYVTDLFHNYTNHQFVASVTEYGQVYLTRITNKTLENISLQNRSIN